MADNVFADPNFGADPAQPAAANPFADPEFGKPRSALGEIITAGKRGLYQGVAGAGSVLQGAGEAAGVEPGVISHVGKALEDWGKGAAQGQDLAAQPDSHGPVTNFLAGAAEAPGSALPLLAGAVGGSIAGTAVAGPVGGIVGGALGGGSEAGLQAYHEKYQQALAAGMSKADAQTAARNNALIQGGLMAGVSAIPFAGGIAGKLVGGASKDAAEAASEVVAKKFLPEAAKAAAETAAVNVGLGAAGAAGENLADQGTALDQGKTTGQAALDSLAPNAAGAAGFIPLALWGAHGTVKQAQAVRTALTDPSIDPQLRIKAASQIAQAVKGTDKDAAHVFADNALEAVKQGKPIGVDPSWFEGPHDSLKPEEAPPAPDAPLALPAPGQVAQPMGNDTGMGPIDTANNEAYTQKIADETYAARDAEDARLQQLASNGPISAAAADAIRTGAAGEALDRRGQEAEQPAALPEPPDYKAQREDDDLNKTAGIMGSVPLDRAQHVAQVGEMSGYDLSVVPHPGGGFTVVPSSALSDAHREQFANLQRAGELPSPTAKRPNEFIADSQGNVRPKTVDDGDRAGLHQSVSDFERVMASPARKQFPLDQAAAQAKADNLTATTGAEHEVVPHPLARNKFAVQPADALNKGSAENLQSGPGAATGLSKIAAESKRDGKQRALGPEDDIEHAIDPSTALVDHNTVPQAKRLTEAPMKLNAAQHFTDKPQQATTFEKQVLAAAIQKAKDAGAPDSLLNRVRHIYTMDREGALGVYHWQDQSMGISRDMIRAASTNPFWMRKLVGTILHEHGHAHDEISKDEGYFSSSHPSFGIGPASENGRRAPTGGIMKEAYQAAMNHPLVRQYLKYPLEMMHDRVNDDEAHRGNLQNETFAQLQSLFYTNPKLLRETMPKAYSLFKDIHERADRADGQGDRGARSGDRSGGQDGGAAERRLSGSPDGGAHPVSEAFRAIGADGLPASGAVRTGDRADRAGAGDGRARAGLGQDARLGERPAEAVEPGGRDERGSAESAQGPDRPPLVGLPKSSPGPFAPAREAAASYMKEAGLPYEPPTKFARVDPAYAKTVADAYEAMAHAPQSPEVKRAYSKMIDETVAQWHAMMKTGLKVSFTDAEHPYPYKLPHDVFKDVRDNNHMWVYSTDEGFGGPEAAKTFDPSENPLLSPTDIKVGGKTLLANDVFRAVHDYFGHIEEGVGFRHDGEENAWRVHSAMFSPEARAAMTSETRGQNSWVNWGPHGEKNRTASQETTEYAAQKSGLLPDEFHADRYEPRKPDAMERKIDADPRSGDATVNIGLDTNDGKGITREDALKALKRAGVKIKVDEVRKSKTEQTLVATLDRALTADEAHKVAVELKQEAIAQKVGDVGELHGPGAEAWRPFNKKFFLEHSKEGESALISRKADETLTSAAGTALTPAERAILKSGVPRVALKRAQRFAAIFNLLPKTADYIHAALAGRAARNWYKKSRIAGEAMYGQDYPRFSALMAALSPQTDVPTNFYNAATVWSEWNRKGRPTDAKSIVDILNKNMITDDGKKAGAEVMDAYKFNTIRALRHETGDVQLSGPKVESFRQNLIGNLNEVTNDRHNAAFSGIMQTLLSGDDIDPPESDLSKKFIIKSPGYIAPSIRYREAAKALTKAMGEPWSPAEVQETSWSFWRTLYNMTTAEGETRSALQLIKDGALTHELIAETPTLGQYFDTERYHNITRGEAQAADGDAVAASRISAAERGVARETGPVADTPAIRRIARRLDDLVADRKSAADAKAGDKDFAETNKELTLAGHDNAPELEAPGDAAENAVPTESRNTRAMDDDGTRFSKSDANPNEEPKHEPLWYSPLRKALDEKAPFPKSGEMDARMLSSWLDARSKDGTVKGAELEASGIKDWLALAADAPDAKYRKVSRADVQSFLDQNGVRVEEKMLGGNDDPSSKLYAIRNEKSGLWEVHDSQGRTGDSASYGTSSEAHRAISDMQAADTKYGSWQLPGGKNYRELLLTLPRQEVVDRAQEHLDRIGAENKRLYDEGVPADDPRWDANQAEWDSAQAAYGKVKKQDGKPEFHSSHFNEPNILAHVRFNERTDADGKKVLFLEELQSDWAQKGRKQGFKDDAAVVARKLAEDRYNAAQDAIRKGDNSEAAVKEYDDASAAMRAARDVQNSDVPSAPFVNKTEAWTALALKRMIRYAADNGFDRIAWTNGDQQAERYDLSKQADTVKLAPRGDGKYRLMVSKGNVSLLDESDIPMSRVEDLVGKDVARKLGEAEPAHNGVTVLKGEDLKVGGEGMKAFYDKIVPNVANDVLKKLGGGRVGEVRIENAEETKLRGELANTDSPGLRTMLESELSGKHALSQPGFDVPARGREKQPLFARSDADPRESLDQTKTPAFRKWFGDSKVVDAKGEPLVVHHGTAGLQDDFEPQGSVRPFDAFDKSRLGSVSGSHDSKAGIWFSDSVDRARMAGRDASAVADDGNHYKPHVLDVYLSMKNPLVVDDISEHSTLGVARLAAKAKRDGRDGIIFKKGERPAELGGAGGSDYLVFEPTQIKSATDNNGQFDQRKPSFMESRSDADPRAEFDKSGNVEMPAPTKQAQPISDTNMPPWVKHLVEHDEGMRDTLRKAGVYVSKAPLKQRWRELKDQMGLKIIQGTVDQFRPILEKIGAYPYKLLRMAGSSDSALAASLDKGQLELNSAGALQIKKGTQSLLDVLKPLQGETDRFFTWVAGNRAERLSAEDREHLFGTDDISRLKSLNTQIHAADVFPGGESRPMTYAKVLRDYNTFSKSVMDIAEKSGIINGEKRALWEHQFYVPFFREAEEGGREVQMGNLSGMVNQYAFKKLKGGEGVLHDLLANTVQNWGHLLSASMKNQAAVRTLAEAEKLGIAHTVNPNVEKGSVYVLKDGKQVHYVVDDPLVLDAVSSLEQTPFRGPIMKGLSAMKHALTVGTTWSPVFRIRHTLREQITALAANPTTYNFVKNWIDGFKYSDKNNPAYGNMEAGGAFMRMGQQLDYDRAAYLKRLVAQGVDQSTVLDTPGKVKAMFGHAFDWWKETGERSDSITRANIYRQQYDAMIKAGKSADEAHFEAAYAARDVMDFGLHGTWAAVRMLTQVVPFMNARMQGIYKLGRGAAEDPKRFAGVIGGITLATIALSLANRDDKDIQKAEEFDRDNNWLFKVGKTMYRIPKPFEVGALATVVDRALETALSGFAPSERERFANRLIPIIGSQLNLNPIPQGVFPAIELWANKDVFTGRAIENAHDENLSPTERYSGNTTQLARGLSNANAAALSFLPRATADKGTLSPDQIDFLVNAYLGWVGSHAVATADLLARPIVGAPDKATKKIDNYFLVGDFAKELPQNQSRFVEQFYEHLKQVQQSFGDMTNQIKMGKPEKAMEIRRERAADIQMHPMYAAAQNQLGMIGARQRFVQMSENMTPDQKRAELDQLAQRRNQITEMIETNRSRIQNQ